MSKWLREVIRCDHCGKDITEVEHMEMIDLATGEKIADYDYCDEGDCALLGLMKILGLEEEEHHD